MSLRLLFVALLFVTPFRAADAPDKDPALQQLHRVNAEVQRRKALREQAEHERAAKEVNARQVIEDDASGLKKATPEEITAAREVIRQAEERKARGHRLPDPEEKVMMMLPDADMATWAAAWKIYFGQVVTVTDRAKNKSASLRVAAPTPIKDVKPLMISALNQAGVYVIEVPNGAVFDTEPGSATAAPPEGTGGEPTQPAH